MLVFHAFRVLIEFIATVADICERNSIKCCAYYQFNQYDIHIQLIIPSLSGSSQPVTNSLEMKYKADASTAYVTEFEPDVKRLITDDDDVAAVVISGSAISAERPVEEEGTSTCWDKNTFVVK